MTNQELIEKFYSSFAQGNVIGMIECYHDQITFKDPAFGELKGERAKAMWKMLLSRGNSEIEFNNVQANEKTGSANWKATYYYGPKKRKVINHISAQFEFKDGRIISHVDDFNLWKWTQQALGTSGFLMGWSSFMKKKINQKTNHLLDKFMKK